MTRHRVFSLARTTGHAAWWIFMVATLFAGGITWTGIDRSFFDTEFSARSGTTNTGDLTLYSAYSDEDVFSDYYGDLASTSLDRWTELELWSMAAFVVVLLAAVVEAISARQVLPGVVTVAVPCAAFGLLLLATPGVLDTVEFNTTLTVSVVLIAVAAREVWARRFAPKL
ncbi:hypothetical protein [Williamsia sp. DF01-3]|uniref:hypothetical protein n=1 Tax=Williamsia sp. DF01-3 TaxID=2934157 RepID=UPI001FF303EE|nr:hypothetical protein [Williamsia sp. DF01-3]MCK0517092.1 hypothetical protein [Williamsia sp. DF01-3]